MAKFFKRADLDVSSSLLSQFKQTDIHVRNLPHWGQDGVLVFGTFRLADSLPADVTRRWQEERDNWMSLHPQPWDAATLAEYAERFPNRMEKWLDAGAGECILRRPECRVVVENALEFFHGSRYDLHAYVVMPNHVHVLFDLAKSEELARIFHSWKSFTAKEINRALKRTGTVWQSEYFDRIIRTADHYRKTANYIAQNGMDGARGMGVRGMGVPPVECNGQDGRSPIGRSPVGGHLK